MAAYLVYLATAALPLSLSPLPRSSGEADEPVARSPVSCRFRPAVRVLSRRAPGRVQVRSRSGAENAAENARRVRACVCVCVCVACVLCARARCGKEEKVALISAAISRDQVRVLSLRASTRVIVGVFSRFADRKGASISDSESGDYALILKRS